VSIKLFVQEFSMSQNLFFNNQGTFGNFADCKRRREPDAEEKKGPKPSSKISKKLAGKSKHYGTTTTLNTLKNATSNGTTSQFSLPQSNLFDYGGNSNPFYSGNSFQNMWPNVNNS